MLILWIFTFFNGLLFYFIVFILFHASVTIKIPSHTLTTITTTTHQNISNNTVLWIECSVITIAAEHIIHATAVLIIEPPHKNVQIIKNCVRKSVKLILYWQPAMVMMNQRDMHFKLKQMHKKRKNIKMKQN